MAQQQKGKGGNNRRQNNSTYTNSNFTSYDEQVSALSFSFANEGSFIDVAPIIPAMIGRTPKQGEKVYDYENRVNTFISPQHAILLRKALENLLELDEDDIPAKTEVTIPTGQGIRRVTIIAPGRVTLKIKGKKTSFPDNFMIKLETKKSDDETILAYHILQNNVVSYISGEETSEEVVENDILMLIAFCNTVIELGLSQVRHVASMTRNLVNASAPSSSAKKGGSAFSNMDDDDDGEDEDYAEESSDDDEDGESSKRSSKRTPTAKKSPVSGKKQRKSITAEIDDEDGEDYDDDIPM